jgi:hypothetical protein
MANNKSPNEKQPDENPEGKYHFILAIWPEKSLEILSKRPKTVPSRMRTRKSPTVRTS